MLPTLADVKTRKKGKSGVKDQLPPPIRARAERSAAGVNAERVVEFWGVSAYERVPGRAEDV